MFTYVLIVRSMRTTRTEFFLSVKVFPTIIPVLFHFFCLSSTEKMKLFQLIVVFYEFLKILLFFVPLKILFSCLFNFWRKVLQGKKQNCKLLCFAGNFCWRHHCFISWKIKENLSIITADGLVYFSDEQFYLQIIFYRPQNFIKCGFFLILFSFEILKYILFQFSYFLDKQKNNSYTRFDC